MLILVVIIIIKPTLLLSMDYTVEAFNFAKIYYEISLS